MMNHFTLSVRALLSALTLIIAIQVTNANPTIAQVRTVATARTTSRTKNDTTASERDGVPAGGLLIIAGVVGGVIVLAWICSRVSDNRRGNLMS